MKSWNEQLATVSHNNLIQAVELDIIFLVSSGDIQNTAIYGFEKGAYLTLRNSLTGVLNYLKSK